MTRELAATSCERRSLKILLWEQMNSKMLSGMD